MGDVLQLRPRQPDSARQQLRDIEMALPLQMNPFATFPVPTLAREPNNDLLTEIFGDEQ